MIQGTATSDEPHTAVRDDTAARPAAAPVPGELARLGRRSFSRGLVAETQESGKNDFARPQRRDRPRNGEALRPGARQETLREANLLVLTEEIFAAAEPLSRADLSIRTGMTRSTVSRLVDELLAAGIVREGSPVVGGARGRPAVPLTPARKTLAGLGVEVNVNFMAARALDLTGAVLSEEIIEGDYRDSDPAQVLGSAGALAGRVAAAAQQTGARVVGTVAAIPGLVAGDERSLLYAPNLGWKSVDVIDAFGAGWPERPGFALVVNEAKLAALAVAEELTAEDLTEQTFIYLSAQAGIGSAVVVDGLVDPGPHGWAGEIGHLTVEPSGPQCSCGSTGCLEVYAGKHSLLQAAGLSPTGTAEDLVSLTEGDDDAAAQARAAVAQAGEALGVALSGAVNLVDVHDVVLGGEFAPLTDLLRSCIEAQLRQRVLAAEFCEFRVRESRSGLSPAASGGALRALRAVIEAPQDWVPAA
ncbi:ROK family transcriptional regulator [Nesterenkonia populi]|uniref:ROK family transcriptional regulator n=1 Tax=Nesterenkonia populi TaxID=1591087 RepID=UPI0011BF4798|nr:ROK family transcriptional regulator [Nesterenkonia populi]